jgi:hypothetical protein
MPLPHISVKAFPPQGGPEIAVDVTSVLPACPLTFPVITQLRSDCRAGYATSAHFRDYKKPPDFRGPLSLFL